MNYLVSNLSDKATKIIPLVLAYLRYSIHCFYQYSLTCSCPISYYYDLLPHCSKLLLHSSFSSEWQAFPKKKQLLLFIQWIISRYFTYKQQPSSRTHLFNFVFAVCETTRFEWIRFELSSITEKECSFKIPSTESSLTVLKLIKVIIKTAAIETRVDLDFLYKDTVACYNNIL